MKFYTLMDSSEIIYVITSDNDLPILLQVLQADGTLQPQILPKSSLPRPVSGGYMNAVTVYDEQGNDITGDVTTEAYEYVVDENGEVCPWNNAPNSILSCDSSAIVSTTVCSKSILEDVMEPNVVSNVEQHGSPVTFSEDSNLMKLREMQCKDQEVDTVDVSVTAAESVQVSDSSNVVDVNSYVEHLTDDTLRAFTVEITPDTDQNINRDSVSYANNSISVCTNSCPLSQNSQDGIYSVPSSSESLCEAVSDDVHKVDFVTDYDDTTTECSRELLSGDEKHIDANDKTVVDALKAVDTALTDVNNCDAIRNSSVQLSPPSSDCLPMFCFHDHSDFRHQFADQSELNSTSAARFLTNICRSLNSVDTVLLSADRDCIDYKALCKCSSQIETPVPYSTTGCQLDSSECHCSSHLDQPAICDTDTTPHNSFSSSPSAESGFCKTDKNLCDNSTTVSVADNLPSSEPVSGVAVSKMDDYNVSDCDHCHVSVLSQCDVMVPSFGTEEAQQCVCETEMPSSSNVSVDMMKHSEANCSVVAVGCHGTDLEESVPQKDDSTLFGDVRNTDCVDDISSDEKKQKLTDTNTNEDCLLQAEITTDCTTFMSNGNCPNDDNNMSSASVADLSTLTSEVSIDMMNHIEANCSVAAVSCHGTTLADSVSQKNDAALFGDVRNADCLDDISSDERTTQKLTDTVSNANEDCLLQAEIITDCTTCYTCNGNCPNDDAVCDTDRTPHNSFSSSPSAESGFCKTDENVCDSRMAVSVADNLPSGKPVSCVTVSKMDDCNVSDCDHCRVSVLSECDVPVPSFGTEKADYCVFETEIPSTSNASVGMMNHRETNCSVAAVGCRGTDLEDSVSQKDDSALFGDVRNTDCVDDISSDEKTTQKLTDTISNANEDCLLQADITTDCMTFTSNGNCPNEDAVCSNLSSASAADVRVAGESCLVSEVVQNVIDDSVSHIGDEQFAGGVADTECQLETTCLMNHAYNGCYQNLLEVVSNLSNDVHKMRQRLRVLHRTKHRLMKLQWNKLPVSAVDPDMDMLCNDAMSAKRLRLAAIDWELADRDAVLQRREKQMGLWLQRVEQREQALFEREQLLAEEIRCLSSSQHEHLDLVTDTKSQPVVSSTHLPVQRNQPAAETNHKSPHRCVSARHLPHRFCKRKVFFFC